MVDIALYQPDIPQNVGATMRLAACMGADLHIIHPCGFPWDERKIRRSGMDYADMLTLHTHNSWDQFKVIITDRRLVLLTTKAAVDYCNFHFKPGDILLAGRESAGVPGDVHDAVHARVTIPMTGAARSLNVVNALSMVLGEAMRQTRPEK